MGDDAFERRLNRLVETGAMVPPVDATPEEMTRFRSWAADVWLSWRRWDIEHPHEGEIDIERARFAAGTRLPRAHRFCRYDQRCS
jgi:hypothetical protein